MQNFSEKTDVQAKEIPILRQESSKVKKYGNKFCVSTPQKRILIVEDDEMLRSLMSSMITMMGFDVTSAESGDEALNQFEKMPFDLVLTDLNMPGMDGWRLARHIKSLSPGTPVVLSTAENRKQTLEKVIDSSVDLVLFKPFGFKECQIMLQKMFCFNWVDGV
jgi:CheY-like chemotaxis protein